MCTPETVFYPGVLKQVCLLIGLLILGFICDIAKSMHELHKELYLFWQLPLRSPGLVFLCRGWTAVALTQKS